MEVGRRGGGRRDEGSGARDEERGGGGEEGREGEGLSSTVSI